MPVLSARAAGMLCLWAWRFAPGLPLSSGTGALAHGCCSGRCLCCGLCDSDADPAVRRLHGRLRALVSQRGPQASPTKSPPRSTTLQTLATQRQRSAACPALPTESVDNPTPATASPNPPPPGGSSRSRAHGYRRSRSWSANAGQLGRQHTPDARSSAAIEAVPNTPSMPVFSACRNTSKVSGNPAQQDPESE